VPPSILLAELKARCPDLAPVRTWLGARATHERTVRQVDTYFIVGRGRLKLREVEGQAAQLIQYERPNVAEVKRSAVRVVPVDDGAALRAALEDALGVWRRVVKTREIWRWNGVQVHLDTVDGLGTFLEFEETVADPRRLAAAQAHLRRLLADLGIPATALLAGSYSDLPGA